MWSGRLGFSAGLGMRDRRGMDVGCESGAGAPGPSEFRASRYFLRFGSPALERAKQNPSPFRRAFQLACCWQVPYKGGGGPVEPATVVEVLSRRRAPLNGKVFGWGCLGST